MREPRIRLDVEERRSQLVELGLQHFGERAYDDVSIDAIADAAGISKGLLYHYFPTKRAYYAATVKEAASRLVASTDTGDGRAPLASLQAGLDAYLAYVKAHAKAYATLMRSGVGVDPEIARIVDETRATFVDRLMSGFAVSETTGLSRCARRSARPARLGRLRRSREPRMGRGHRGGHAGPVSGRGSRAARRRAHGNRPLGDPQARGAGLIAPRGRRVSSPGRDRVRLRGFRGSVPHDPSERSR